MRTTQSSLLIALVLVWANGTIRAQVGSFEKVVAAPLYPNDGIAKAAQLEPYEDTCVLVSNPFIGALGDADMLLQRLASDGSILQDLTIGDTHGQGYHDVAKEAVSIDNHIYICGYTRDIDTSAAHTFTAVLIEVDVALSFIAQKNYIMPDGEMYADAMTPSGDAMLLIAGKIYDGNDFRSYVMRTDLAGALIWIKQYDMPNGETIECIRELPGGDILLSGSMVFGFELQLPFVCKLNADGEFLWGKYYNYPPGFVERSNFQHMQVASVDDILIAGVTDKFGAGGTDFYVVDIDSSGMVNWARTYGGSQFEEPSGTEYDALADELVMLGSSGSFGTLGEPNAIAMRIAPNGNLLGAALYGDTSLYLPSRLYQSCRFGPNERALVGSRDFPADDMYIAGTDGTLANSCNYYPVAPLMSIQTTGTGAFSAVVTIPVLEINELELGPGHFADDTTLCDQPTGMNDAMNISTGLCLLPSSGDGVFQLLVPASFTPALVRVFDLQGRLVCTVGNGQGEVRLPSTIAAGTYQVQVLDQAGRQITASYQLR